MVLLLLLSIVSMTARALKRRTTLVVRAWELDRGPTACIGSPRSMDRVTCAPWQCILHLERLKFRVKVPPSVGCDPHCLGAGLGASLPQLPLFPAMRLEIVMAKDGEGACWLQP